MSRRRIALLAVGLAVLFGALTAGFVVLLEPLARPALRSDDSPAIKSAASPPVVAAPVLAAPVAPTPAPLPSGPVVAILLTDAAGSAEPIDRLPPEIGIVLSPYSAGSAKRAAALRATGRDVWAGIPMQPKRWPAITPGENTLLVDSPAAENVARLDWALRRIGPVTGVTSIMGSAFTENGAALLPVMAALKSRNLAYVDARASGASVALATAQAAGVRAALNQRFLDGPEMAANLAALEAAAQADGRALGLASASPDSVAAIRNWAAGLDARGIRLGTAAEIAR